MRTMIAMAIVLTTVPAGATECPSSSWLTGGIAAGAGVAASFAASGIAIAADDARGYNYFVGAGIGASVTTGLALVFAILDSSTRCPMTRSGIAWSAPISLFIVGGALPLMVWGAADTE